jgi:aspartate aminotransferase
VDVAAFLLEHARVALVPGQDFGSDAHVRLSYATSADLIREGLARIDNAVRALA